jgi:hypothetical protein
VISTDTKYTGAGVETPPAVGMCTGDQVRLLAPTSAPWTGTALPSAGAVTPIRLRGQLAAAGLTGSFIGGAVGVTARQTTALQVAVAGVPTEHTSSTPGDLPPEDPLSR